MAEFQTQTANNVMRKPAGYRARYGEKNFGKNIAGAFLQEESINQNRERKLRPFGFQRKIKGDGSGTMDKVPRGLQPHLGKSGFIPFVFNDRGEKVMQDVDIEINGRVQTFKKEGTVNIDTAYLEDFNRQNQEEKAYVDDVTEYIIGNGDDALLYLFPQVYAFAKAGHIIKGMRPDGTPDIERNGFADGYLPSRISYMVPASDKWSGALHWLHTGIRHYIDTISFPNGVPKVHSAPKSRTEVPSTPAFGASAADA